MWSKKFTSLPASRKYFGVLKGRVKVPPNSQVLDEKVAADKKLIVARRANLNVYSDLILSYTGEVSFGIIEGSVTDDLPESDAKLIWNNSKKKQEPTSNKNEIELKKQCDNTSLKSWKKDTYDWIFKLEIIRKRLNHMKNKMSNED